MLSAADLRGPERRGLFFSPDLGHTRYTDKNLQAGPRQRRVRLRPGRATAAGDYVVAPLVEAGRTRYRGQASSGGLSAEGRAASTTSAWASWRATGSWAARMPRPRAQRTHARQLPTISMAGTNCSRSNYWGARHAGPCGAVERARQLDAYARVQWQRLGGDAVRTTRATSSATTPRRRCARLGARYVYVAAATDASMRRWQEDARTEVRARLGKALCRRRRNAARDGANGRALGAIAVMVAAPERARPVRGEQGIGRGFRLSTLLRRYAGRAQVGRWASTVSRICITYSPQSCATRAGSRPHQPGPTARQRAHAAHVLADLRRKRGRKRIRERRVA